MRWTARSFCFSSDCDGEPPYVLAFAGYYTDRVMEVDGEWLFEERVIKLWRGEVLQRLPHAASKAAPVRRQPEVFKLTGGLPDGVRAGRQ